MTDNNIPVLDETENVEKQPSETEQNAKALMEALLGFTAEEARTDPDLAQAKLEEQWLGVKRFLERVTSEDETELEAAREQMRGLRATLEKHGVETNDDMESLTDSLHARYHTDQVEQNERIAQSMQKLAEVIAEAGQKLGEELQKEAERRLQQPPDNNMST